MLRRLAPALVISGALAAALVTAVVRFNPWTVHANFNSDAAIPVLMCNAHGFTAFDLYYWGQDRFGALPWLLARLFRAITGFTWTPDRLAAIHAFAALATAWPLSRLFRDRLLWAALAAIAILASSSAAIIFNVSQPYGWQLPLLFFAWWAIRALRVAERASVRHVLVAILAVLLASWESALSAPILLVIALCEALAIPRTRWKSSLLVLGVVPVGGALEAIIRGTFQVYAKHHFGHSYRTSVHLVFSGALDAFSTLARNPVGPGVFFTAVSLVGGLVAGALLLVRWWRRDDRPRSDELVAAAGFGGALLVQMTLLSLGSHFRENGLDGRYLAIAEVCAILGTASIAIGLLRRFVSAKVPLALGYAAAGALSLCSLWVARSPVSEELLRARTSAEELAAKRPGALLLAGYWESFLLAGLAPPDALIPVVPTNQYRRSPFNEAALENADLVWVGTDVNAYSDERPLDVNAPYLLAPGTLLERSPEPPVTAGDRTFVPFRSARAHLKKEQVVKECAAPLELVAPDATTLVVAHPPEKSPLRVKAFDETGAEVSLSPFSGHLLDAYRAEGPARQLRFTVAPAPSSTKHCSVESLYAL